MAHQHSFGPRIVKREVRVFVDRDLLHGLECSRSNEGGRDAEPKDNYGMG
jgi:hypothetical protein